MTKMIKGEKGEGIERGHALTSFADRNVALTTCEPSADATIWNALLTPVVLVTLSLTDASGGLRRSGSEASSGSDAWEGKVVQAGCWLREWECTWTH